MSEGAIEKLLASARSAKNGGTFSKLFDGDISKYGNDASRADAALCSMLAFWTQDNEVAIDQIFRRSKLVRGKWLDRPDYRARTIRSAINLMNRGINDVFEVIESNTVEVKSSHVDRSIRAFLMQDIEKPKPIIRGIVNEGETIILSGPAKLGKSMLLANMSIHIAAGRETLARSG